MSKFIQGPRCHRDQVLSARPGTDAGPARGAGGDRAARHPPPHAAVRGGARRRCRRGCASSSARSQDVLVLAASGTGAMEGSVTNLLSPGDEVIVVNGGKFGERWTKICQTYGVTVHEIRVEWGRAVVPQTVARGARRASRRRARVYMQASETSTCALHPVAEVAELTRQDATRCSSSTASRRSASSTMPMDRLGIDVLVTGSQKALMLPPGLAFVALSPRAWEATERAKLPRFYFDFKRERKGVAENSTAWTPAISLINGLRRRARHDARPRAGRTSTRGTTGWRGRRAPARQALGLCAARARSAEPGGDRRDRCRPASTAARSVRYLRDRMRRDVRGRAGPAEGQDRPPRAPRLRRRVRRRGGARGARAGAARTSARRVEPSAAASAPPRRSSAEGLPARG